MKDRIATSGAFFETVRMPPCLLLVPNPEHEARRHRLAVFLALPPGLSFFALPH